MSVNYSFRNAPPAQLAAYLLDARNYTLSLFACFEKAGLDKLSLVPYLPIINPPLWELGHLVWFTEWFILRGSPVGSNAMEQHPSLLAGSDLWFDSARIAHATRWQLDLPATRVIKQYANEVLLRILEKLSKLPNNNEALYLYRLALAHEDMHGEAFAYTLQTLGIAALPALSTHQSTSAPQRQLQFDGGQILLGSVSNEFIFDNEKLAHEVYIFPYTIDSSLVTNAQYKKFILAGGYQNSEHWDVNGQAWLALTQRTSPRYWKLTDGVWQCKLNATLTKLIDTDAVRHISLHEARAYCHWAHRRLPTETEWEYAATLGNPNFYWGELWEWTSTPFEPYPGFSPDVYKEYSAPWFYTHQALRGASCATQQRIRSPRYRNFYLHDRDDIFVGFRTCAL